MVETFCVCCGAETDRDWHHAAPLEDSVCETCAIELDAVRGASRIDEIETIAAYRLGA